tara:strand:- start:292 stop:1125 length:834 start_codon:yes stop_codon:yes gene_type:complete
MKGLKMNQKDAYYFPHDSNARNDQRLMKVRMKYGMEGYGIYFGIIEILREQKDYILTYNDIESISFDLRTDKEKIEDIIQNYNLFEIKGHTMFYSKSLKRRLECMDEKKKKRVEAGRLGGIASAKSKQKSTNATTNAKALNYTKQNKTKQNNIKDKSALFKKQVFEFTNQFNIDLLNEFYNYWSEPNKSNTKMKFQMEKTWDLNRRLKRWAGNDFGNKSNGVKKKINFKMPDGRNYYAYCSKCNKGDFYDPYNFNPESVESKCCNSKIIAERNKEIA